MKESLLTMSFAILISSAGFSQQVYLEQFIQPTGGQLTDTLDDGTIITLDLSTDDVEQENDEVDSYFDDDLDAGWEGAPEDENLLTLGLRFIDLTIPAGAVIDSAFVVFHAHEGKSEEDVAELTIVGEATDDAMTFDEDGFNDDFLLTDRPQTTAQVEWTVAEDWIIWQPYKTPDISPIVQELVNRPGWESGNAIALIFLPTDQGPSVVENAREFTSFENIADPDDVDPEGNPGDGTNWPERRPYIQVYYQGTLSTAEIQENLFRVYPNPVVNREVKLELASSGNARVSIMNVAGQEVRNFDLKGQSAKLNLEGLNEGLYMMHVSQNGYLSTKRLVIK